MAARSANRNARQGQQALPQTGVVQRKKKRVKKSKKKKSKAGRTPYIGARIPTVYAGTVSGRVPDLHAAAADWARLLANPSLPPVKCPFNFNPVPSMMSFVATTSCTRQSAFTSAAGGGLQMTVFPGHGIIDTMTLFETTGTIQSTLSDFDEVAYHYAFQSDGGAAITCHGPCNYIDTSGTTRPCIAFWYQTTASGSTAPNTSGAAPVGWDAPLPIIGDVRQQGHLRIKLVSMSVEVINVTPELNRGGSIVTVQPASVSAMPASVNALNINPSFYDHGPERAKVTWIPRLRDLAYWHPSKKNVAATGIAATTNDVTSAGIFVFCNAGSTAQTYDVNIVAHWEISGYSVQTLATAAKSTNLSDSVLKGALSAHSMTSPSATGFESTLRAAAGFAVKVASNAGGKFGTAARVAANAL